MITLNKEDAFTIVDIISKAQEVIRCKDCKYWLKQGHGYPNVCIRDDMELAYDESAPLEMDADDFCSQGEKRDE